MQLLTDYPWFTGCKLELGVINNKKEKNNEVERKLRKAEIPRYLE